MINPISSILGGNDVSPGSHTEQYRASDTKPTSIFDHLVKEFDLDSLLTHILKTYG
jgi:hypothetical protein